tara:strand:- start:224 stop:523 length:300 start_codon:yes stop_codon:yes gene_type:complete
MAEPTHQDKDQQQSIQVHVSPDLDYSYRDVANIFVGAGDVVFEFGNLHRSMPGNITISNRIVLSMANAYDLQQKLGQVLQEAQKQMQEQFKQQQAQAKE